MGKGGKYVNVQKVVPGELPVMSEAPFPCRTYVAPGGPLVMQRGCETGAPVRLQPPILWRSLLGLVAVVPHVEVPHHEVDLAGRVERL